jgi:hypothetical protein
VELGGAGELVEFLGVHPQPATDGHCQLGNPGGVFRNGVHLRTVAGAYWHAAEWADDASALLA